MQLIDKIGYWITTWRVCFGRYNQTNFYLYSIFWWYKTIVQIIIFEKQPDIHAQQGKWNNILEARENRHKKKFIISVRSLCFLLVHHILFICNVDSAKSHNHFANICNSTLTKRIFGHWIWDRNLYECILCISLYYIHNIKCGRYWATRKWDRSIMHASQISKKRTRPGWTQLSIKYV